MNRARSDPGGFAAAAALAVALMVAPCLAGPAAAQLRPIDPIDWDMLERRATFFGTLGMGVLYDQRASLAGTKGTLLELGNFLLSWRSGRISLELAGTASRRFRDESVFRPPSFGADPPNGHLRTDAGDVRAATTVRLTSERAPPVVIRFGTRLPTTSEEVGLDRDRTDFFASLGARLRAGSLAFSGESGVGIFGTRIPDYDQTDVWTYAAGLEYDLGVVTPSAWFLGQQDGTSRELVGNEDLRELRVGIRAGERRWVQATLVRGFATYSPGSGFLLVGGIIL